MMTVATKVEAPVKFLYTAPPSDTPKSYPFSVLGLGDGEHLFVDSKQCTVQSVC
jgi:hypothetical protein